MANKTDRILGYLPSTFRAQPRPTALYSVIDAFGGELLGAENSLAAVMQAHWVDVADLGAEVLDDLGRFAALYGLGPRLDESVEEFREHLKRYVRTFLDGTVTVRGILRVTAEALGLHIDDDHLEVVGAAELHTVERRGDDAAAAVLGVSEAGATGTPALPARLAGNVDLRGGVVLPPGAKLRLGVDGGQPVDVTLADRAAARSLDDLVHAVNEAMGAPVAEAVAGRLVLSSPTVGAAGRLAIPDVDGDAADAVLGLAPRAYRGSAARPARVVGTVHLGPTVDLHDERYLRVQIDGTHLAEVDCAGQDPAATLPTEVRDAVNAALGLDVAALDGDLLTLTSPTAGFDSRIDLLAPAAQDATARLLGTADRLRLGMDAQPARVIGRRDLSAGVDLRQAATIALRIDGGGPLSVDCARFAIDPAAVRLPEIVLAMNTALGRQLASHDGRFLTVASAAVEEAGTVTLDTPATGDATAAVFGVGPREFSGADMTAARVTGRVDLGSGVDLRAQHLLVVAVDDRPPVAVDLRAGAAAAHAVTLTELAGAIDRVVGSDTGGREGPHLTITSPTTGPGSRVVVEPLEVSRSRRFVTRAVVVDDAAQVLLGYSAAAAMGTPATAARLVGTVDLNRGADLRDGSHLRLGVDGGPLLEVDCVGDRPRAVPLATVVTAVNDAFAPIGFTPAGDDGRHLVLTSPSEGGASRITVADSHELDAADRLLGVAPGTARGSDATAVRFTGTVDLGGGVDLEPDAAVSIGVDGAAPVEILLGRPATRGTQDELVAAVNAKLGAPIAGRNGTRLSLTSPTSGSGSRIEFAQPAGPDATGQIFGIPSGRSYHGAAGTQARITGVRDLSGPVDLSHTRFLRIAVDRQPPRSVDCAAGSGNAAAVLLGDIVTAINTGLGLTVASAEGSRLRLASPRTGAAGQLTLEAHTSDAARKRLLGTARQEAAGTAQAPAELVGAVALPGPVDLGERSVLRLAVDGHRPMEVDVAGAAPAGTFLDEVVAAVNAE
ncbi:MAG TPA: hypothetical protein VGP31_10690, partial [Planosporangium sp.]|nr:hypothetical protein [Planosporangium sp.]